MSAEQHPTKPIYKPSVQELLAGRMTLMRLTLPRDNEEILPRHLYPPAELANEANHVYYVTQWLANFWETTESLNRGDDIDYANRFFKSMFYGLAVGQRLLPVRYFGEA